MQASNLMQTVLIFEHSEEAWDLILFGWLIELLCDTVLILLALESCNQLQSEVLYDFLLSINQQNVNFVK